MPLVPSRRCIESNRHALLCSGQEGVAAAREVRRPGRGRRTRCGAQGDREEAEEGQPKGEKEAAICRGTNTGIERWFGGSRGAAPQASTLRGGGRSEEASQVCVALCVSSPGLASFFMHLLHSAPCWTCPCACYKGSIPWPRRDCTCSIEYAPVSRPMVDEPLEEGAKTALGACLNVRGVLRATASVDDIHPFNFHVASSLLLSPQAAWPWCRRSNSTSPKQPMSPLIMLPQDTDAGSYLPPPPEVYGHVQHPGDLPDGSDSESEAQDIYRGSRPPTPAPPRSPSPAPSSSATSTTSSSSSSSFGGPLGAISAGVENAISRWARAWASSSSLSSSSSSSASVVTKSRRRKRRARSISTLHNARSEREVAARIRAREDLRPIPRSFVLYAPKLPQTGIKSQAVSGRRANRAAAAALQDPILRTTSLEDVTARLSTVLKERAKARRTRADPLLPSVLASSSVSRPLSPMHQDYMLSAAAARASSSVPRASRAEGKGKQRAPTVQIPTTPPVIPSPTPATVTLEAQRAPQAWWLDVSSPTWEDMCALGKVCPVLPMWLQCSVNRTTSFCTYTLLR